MSQPKTQPQRPKPQPLHRVAIAGATGRMGRELIAAVRASGDCQLTGALEIADSPAIGQDAGAFLGWESGVKITSDLYTGLLNAQVLIDFTRPQATGMHLPVCQQKGVAMVIGTTGFKDSQIKQIELAAQTIAICLSPNMSVGVNVTFKLIEMAAKALSSGWDVEIIEAHHRHKTDAPSGTALEMGKTVARATERDFKECAVFERYGNTGEREANAIGFSCIRGGDIVGDHTVMFASQGERIEITHRASSRSGYCAGSLRAVRYLALQRKGLFNMRDVLGL